MAAKPDLTEFYRLSRPKKPPCRVGFARSQLKTDVEREQLDAALATDAGIITGAAIIQWFDARGHEVSSSAISSHRNRRCTCAEEGK